MQADYEFGERVAHFRSCWQQSTSVKQVVVAALSVVTVVLLGILAVQYFRNEARMPSSPSPSPPPLPCSLTM